MEGLNGVERIARERARQVAEEGWTAEHDDGWDRDQLALAAVCYAAPVQVYRWQPGPGGHLFVDPWPWEPQWDKRRSRGNIPAYADVPGDVRLRRLEQAGALIAAEIDRLLRVGSSDQVTEG